MRARDEFDRVVPPDAGLGRPAGSGQGELVREAREALKTPCGHASHRPVIDALLTALAEALAREAQLREALQTISLMGGYYDSAKQSDIARNALAASRQAQGER